MLRILNQYTCKTAIPNSYSTTTLRVISRHVVRPLGYDVQFLTFLVPSWKAGGRQMNKQELKETSWALIFSWDENIKQDGQTLRMHEGLKTIGTYRPWSHFIVRHPNCFNRGRFVSLMNGNDSTFLLSLMRRLFSYEHRSVIVTNVLCGSGSSLFFTHFPRCLPVTA